MSSFEFEKLNPAISTKAVDKMNGSLMAKQMATTIRLFGFLVSPFLYLWKMR